MRVFLVTTVLAYVVTTTGCADQFKEANSPGKGSSPPGVVAAPGRPGCTVRHLKGVEGWAYVVKNFPDIAEVYRKRFWSIERKWRPEVVKISSEGREVVCIGQCMMSVGIPVIWHPTIVRDGKVAARFWDGEKEIPQTFEGPVYPEAHIRIARGKPSVLLCRSAVGAVGDVAIVKEYCGKSVRTVFAIPSLRNVGSACLAKWELIDDEGAPFSGDAVLQVSFEPDMAGGGAYCQFEVRFPGAASEK
jgi:hypothetical protein